MLLLNRRQVYITGLLVIFIYYFIDRITFIYNSEFTTGVAISEFEIPDNIPYKYDCNYIKFIVRNKEYFFAGVQYLSYKTGETVSVIYQKNKIEDACVFSFMGFWFTALMWCIWPIMIFSALIYGFLRKKHLIILNIRFPFLKRVKKETLKLPENKI